jgi:chromosome segregation ATPase
MTDENANTADLTPNEKLDQVLRKLGDLDARLAALEARADDRARETRPLLDQIIKEMVETRERLTARMDAMDTRFDAVEKQLRSIDRRFEVFSEDHMRMRADIRDFNERMTDLERRPN